MDIKTKLCNPKNYGGTRATGLVDWIVIHYTSNKGDTAANNATYFARESVGASAHYFVDETEIWNSVPVTATAWHCGAKNYRHKYCRNGNSIGVEVCMTDKGGNVRHESIAHAVSLVRWLMAKYDIPADHVIRHYDVTGKYCPGPMVDSQKLWDDFIRKLEERDLTEQEIRAIVRNEYAVIAADIAQASAHAYAQDAIRQLVAMGVTDGNRPQSPATREEVCTMLYRLMNPTKK